MKALQGIRILDLTHMLSGPYAGMILADLGAESIKVEPPITGEGTRRLLEKDPKNSLNGFGAYYMTLNRNKKSITLDLKSEKGLQVFYELVKTADIVLSNFSAGVTTRLKIDYENLSKINPRIITCTVTGFGETGPNKDRTAFDMVAEKTGEDALSVFKKAMDNIKPTLEVRSRRVGGATYQVPVEDKPARSTTLSLRSESDRLSPSRRRSYGAVPPRSPDSP